MPTIVLNKLTTNPSIPKVPVLGFNDTFNRANAQSLGTTAAGKPWEIIGSAANTWQIVGNTAGALALTSGSFPVIDANTADGTYRIVLSDISQAAGGVSLRVRDSQNLIRVAFRTTSGNTIFRLEQLSNNEQTVLAVATGNCLTGPGDVVEVRLAGKTIEVSSNGVQRIPPTQAPLFTSETKFGFYGVPNDPGIRYDTAEFIPA